MMSRMVSIVLVLAASSAAAQGLGTLRRYSWKPAQTLQGPPSKSTAITRMASIVQAEPSLAATARSKQHDGRAYGDAEDPSSRTTSPCGGYERGADERQSWPARARGIGV